MFKCFILISLLLVSGFANALAHFNVSVGKDFQNPFSDSFDSVYFQNSGDAVTVEKVTVRSKTGECELFVPIRSPMRFKWGRRWSMPMWDCKHKDITEVIITTTTHIYTYGL